jgi:Zn-dependent M28 family amino/carboxypeptidase
VLGEGLTTLDPLIARAARSSGRMVAQNPAVQSFFRRSDNWAFVEAGVPVLGVTSVFPAAGRESPAFADFMANRYHRPGDEWSDALDLSGAAADVELARRVLLLAGNARAAPTWLPGKQPATSPVRP